MVEQRSYKNNNIAAQTPRLQLEILITAVSENIENKPVISKQTIIGVIFEKVSLVISVFKGDFSAAVIVQKINSRKSTDSCVK